MSGSKNIKLLAAPNNELKQLPLLNSANIDSYISYVNAVPVLTEEEELYYAEKLQHEGDLQAAHHLVVSHLRYVVKVAKKYLGYGLQLADLIQEGTIGLMKAVRKFDICKEVRLVTFALHWIRAEIHEFILKNWRIVKVATTKAQRRLFFKLRSMKSGFGFLGKQEIQRIANDLKVKPKDIKLMELRLFNKDNCFDEPERLGYNHGTSYNGDDQEHTLVPAEYLQDFSFAPEVILEKKEWEKLALDKLRKAIIKLDPRSQDILTSRWLVEQGKTTLQDLADKYAVSKERIRQLEHQAIFALKQQIQHIVD